MKVSEMTYDELAQKYTELEKLPEGYERRVKRAHINIQFEVIYADTQIVNARKTLQYAIANGHDVQSIEAYLGNLKRASEHKAMLEERIDLLERLIDEEPV